ncbi:BTAD domain-containing putative transcriptional regulator [Actinoplanes sp. Pm04-4]|uniref:BTAD domain-containing putative transcriptional regulator n=1 Tax=Paractinoplanes pyxinae TaxID=2997416 RepID=A0ABT4ATD0_9ACTN|nr:BTAD domain-containing putative transcriptional regulator [Actinoplanes pyxinae]MCY1136665.1 BTAD domain-containing putative transcriptional regulator [Actinoplanes pyxinae]
MSGDTVNLRILGPLQVWRGGVEVDPGPRQQRGLLAVLLARPGHAAGVGELMELLWGPEPPPSAVNSIQKYVGTLRRLLEPGLPPRSAGAYLTRHGGAYRFTAGPETLDLVRFRRLVAQAEACANLERSLDGYVAALRLGRGAAGAGLADSPEAGAVFANLDREFSDAVVAAARVAVRLRQPDRVLAPLRRAAGAEPLNEVLQASLVTTLAAAGRLAEAVAAYRSARRRLSEDLGVEPGPELRAAYLTVLERDDILIDELIELCDRLPVLLGRLSARLAASGGAP